MIKVLWAGWASALIFTGRATAVSGTFHNSDRVCRPDLTMATSPSEQHKLDPGNSSKLRVRVAFGVELSPLHERHGLGLDLYIQIQSFRGLHRPGTGPVKI